MQREVTVGDCAGSDLVDLVGTEKSVEGERRMIGRGPVELVELAKTERRMTGKEPVERVETERRARVSRW